MKPANFPERVNQRRKDAANRMLQINRSRAEPKPNVDQHINETLAKCSANSLRSVRTKIQRGTRSGLLQK